MRFERLKLVILDNFCKKQQQGNKKNKKTEPQSLGQPNTEKKNHLFWGKSLFLHFMYF